MHPYIRLYGSFELLNFLLHNVQSEETYMIKNNYSKFRQHKSSHQIFKELFIGLKQKFEHEGTSSFFAVHVNKTLKDWLLTHIKSDDVELAKFLKSKNIAC